MQTTQDTLPPLAEYLDLKQLLEVKTIRDKYPTRDSINWLVRRHRDALVNAGAIIMVAGRMHFHLTRFQEAVVAIGRRAMLSGGEQ